ncbi:MAG TPA: RecQ family ATP-dependent DNA helicase [Solirubrobacteraceae bacterium]|nr:RecQ family ATP-dependent DNA helicase [Solirubrobacteraceae bacterium]
MNAILEAIGDARRELESAPAGLTKARARGVLAQARELWGTLDHDEREALSGPAAELRALLDTELDRPTEPCPTPEELLARFRLDAFRPGQREGVQAALDGRDSLVVMPTGAGKTLCYQLPALANQGLVVVVSPLIALMADQWRRLLDAGVQATMLASGMEDGHNQQALREIRSGGAQLVLAAPERFGSRAFREALGQRKVALFVVDEAHCVAEWGHDFRPDYLRLHGAIKALGRPPVMAATATATPRVAEEIAQRLGLRDWVSIRSGFDRPNLTFDVFSVEGKGAVARKRAALLHVLDQERALPAIVYCGTRKDTDDVAALIAGHGISTVAYHAGMAPEDRRSSQDAFMAGQAQVVVATNAFGMGVDKADVRTVAHWAIPTSLEGYYQEAGRGGRDGEPARALLLAARYDLGRLIRFNTERDTSVEDVRAYVRRLERQAEGSVLECGRPGDDQERVLLSIAERSGGVELEPGVAGGIRVKLTGVFDTSAAYGAIQAAKSRGWESYKAIERFISNGSICRRRQILDHFGDELRGTPSGRCCDVCDRDEELERAAVAKSAPASGARRGSRAQVGYARGNGRPAGGATAPRASSGATAPGARRGAAALGVPRGAAALGVPRGAAVPGALRGADGVLEEDLGEPVDQEQFDKLRAWRMGRAEGLPAFRVASNAVLEDVLRARPGDVNGLLAVRGIGPGFCEKHGESLLEALACL